MCEHHRYTGRATESRLSFTNILLGLISPLVQYPSLSPIYLVCLFIFFFLHLLGLLSE